MKGAQFGLEFGGQFDSKLVVNLLRKTLVNLTVFSILSLGILKVRFLRQNMNYW